MKTILFALIIILSSCDPLQVESQNEPKTDLEAFKLAGITYEDESEIIDFEFQSGMDDYMKIVFDIPKNKLSALWYYSEFYESEKIELDKNNRYQLNSLRSKFDKQKNELESVQSGWFSSARVDTYNYANIFITPMNDKYRCYLTWNEM